MTAHKDTAPILLWRGMGLSHREARLLRLVRPLTPEERLARDIRRGGFPLLREEPCALSPGKTIHGILERFPSPASAGRMRP